MLVVVLLLLRLCPAFQDVFAFKEGLPAPPGLKVLAETGDLSTLGVSCLPLGSVVRAFGRLSSIAVSSVCCLLQNYFLHCDHLSTVDISIVCFTV